MPLCHRLIELYVKAETTKGSGTTTSLTIMMQRLNFGRLIDIDSELIKKHHIAY